MILRPDWHIVRPYLKHHPTILNHKDKMMKLNDTKIKIRNRERYMGLTLVKRSRSDSIHFKHRLQRMGI